MRFLHLSVQNFLSIRSVELDLDGRGLVLIQGINEDSEALNNNGSGKSSIIEALIYAVYGKTIRGTRGDALVNRSAGRNLHVFLDLEDDDGTSYRIARYRKHQVNKNRSFVYRNGTDVTPSSESGVNDLIAQLLQADYLTFTSSVLYSAESFKFTSATDADIKHTFDLMLGLDVYQRCLDITRSRIHDTQALIDSSQLQMNRLSDRLSDAMDRLTSDTQNESSYATRVAEQVADIRLKADSYYRQSQEQSDKSKAIALSISDTAATISRLQGEIDSTRSSLERSEDIRRSIDEGRDSIDTSRRSIRLIRRTIEDNDSLSSRYADTIKKRGADIVRAKASMEKLETTVGSPCPTCGQPLTEESILPAKEEYQRNIDSYSSEIVETQGKIDALNEENDSNRLRIATEESSISSMTDRISELTDEYAKTDDMRSHLQQLQVELQQAELEKGKAESQVDYLEKSAKSLASQGNDQMSTAKMLESQANPYTDAVSRDRKEVDTTKSEISELDETLSSASDSLDILRFWERAYSNQGIKSLVLDDITPFLNRRANRYLTALTDGSIEVNFSTQTTLRNGQKRDKFAIEVTNRDGGQEYTANSGGERKRIDLAINLAMQDLVASRGTKKLNIAIFDEAFDALDQEGIERVVALLQSLSSEKSSIFVISHNEYLKSYFDEVITIVKHDGCSTLLEQDSEVSDEQQ